MPQPDITEILDRLEAGDHAAHDALLEAVYDQLRALAESSMRQERPGHTLQPTALVHEAYMKLVDQTRVNWQGKTHFCAVAAQAMRRILVDHARWKNREKRGGAWRRIALHDAFLLTRDDHLDAAALHEALEKMRRLDERQAKVVELRLFGGMLNEQIADMLDISKRTVEREWRMGQAWLRRELSKED